MKLSEKCRGENHLCVTANNWFIKHDKGTKLDPDLLLVYYVLYVKSSYSGVKI